MNKLKIKKNRGMIHSMKTQYHPEYTRGMTYVELIVVLSIFAVLSSVAIFNYGEFQAKVDIKNLASEITSQIVTAQKSSLNGLLPRLGVPFATWKPSYGVYFNIASPKQFIYFTDLSNSNTYEANELLDTISITKNNYISRLEAVGCGPINTLNIVFRRPDSSAVITTNPFCSNISYIQITIASPKGKTALIKIYPSGRVQVN